MKLIERPYSGEADKDEMRALVGLSPADQLHVLDLPYRFSSWAFDYPENIGLWVGEVNESQQLVAWAVLQLPFWTIDYAWHPDLAAQAIHQQILAWADARARAAVDTAAGRPMWFIDVRSSQTEKVAALEAAGFRNQAVAENPWSTVLLSHPGHDPIGETTLPAGFVIRPLLGTQEVEAYVALHQSVFESKNMTVEWRLRTLQQRAYNPELDLVAVAPDGRLAAFCIGWFDKKGFDGRPAGQIEPLGVHEAFRKLKLGKAILAEAIRRLQSQGAEQIYVETDNFRNPALNLYESSGFQIQETIFIYRKDYAIQ